ncbi:MAG: hypothetical protein AB1714_04745 [Acidobacteriota bacterium]
MKRAGMGRRALLTAAAASAGMLLALTAVPAADAPQKRHDRAPGSTEDVTVVPSLSFKGFLVPSSATVTVKVMNGNKPVKGRPVSFMIYQGPHINTPKLSTKTGSDGTASYEISFFAPS